MRVQSYRNLHKEQWSLRDPSTGRVTGHASHVELADVTFRVQAGGRAAVLRDGVRRVHAYVVGGAPARDHVYRADHWLQAMRACGLATYVNSYAEQMKRIRERAAEDRERGPAQISIPFECP